MEDYENDGIDDVAAGFFDIKRGNVNNKGGVAVFFGESSNGLKDADYPEKT